MPILHTTGFIPPLHFRFAHVQTTFPTIFRRVHGVNYKRERIHTEDKDFIDIDWSYARADSQATSLAIICHGLEGSSDRAYMRGMARFLNDNGIDALAFNYRGCSGETNRRLRMYTAGSTDDLQTVIDAGRREYKYASIYLVGFSLGANLILKYAGEAGSSAAPFIKAILAVSPPCDLYSSMVELHRPINRVYHYRFLKTLLDKVRDKYQSMPDLPRIDLSRIKTLGQFDEHFTAPWNGYTDAMDYYRRGTSKPFLKDIRVPSLIITSLDDPLLGPGCYPEEEARSSDYLFLELSKYGGHVGFMVRPNDRVYWHEQRVCDAILAADRWS